jgi:DNA-directed RNA polymerase specialized sigma24 family protein
VSTRSQASTRAPRPLPGTGARPQRASDQSELVAQVSHAKREILLRVHRHRLRREDLEDCYSQATLELLAHTRRGGRFSSRAHAANAIEQRFLSRIHDRRRALSGRSPMQAAIETALPLDCFEPDQPELADVRAELETLVVLRDELRRVESLARELTPDQQLILACQVGMQMGREEFCRRYGWTPEKYRKVAQRARTHLRRLLAQEDRDVPLAVERRKRQQGPTYADISPHS